MQDIIEKLNERKIQEILTFLFNTNELPKILAYAKGNTGIEGFTKINKTTFYFRITFLKNGELYARLKKGVNEIVKIEKYETRDEGIFIGSMKTLVVTF